MKKHLASDWQQQLHDELQSPYFENLNKFVDVAYSTTECFPEKEAVFNAFNACTFNDVSVVIIGQDPYHGTGQANGLCFSVHDGVKHPPSLVNILKELSDNYSTLYPATGDLTTWAKQGVLLLNATLTVAAHQAGSHQKQGWETFTDAVIKHISDHKKEVVFLLWGGYAKKKIKLINHSEHCVLTSGHPSPLSANRGYWFGNKHFIKANEYLKSVGKSEINWNL